MNGLDGHAATLSGIVRVQTDERSDKHSLQEVASTHALDPILIVVESSLPTFQHELSETTRVGTNSYNISLRRSNICQGMDIPTNGSFSRFGGSLRGNFISEHVSAKSAGIDLIGRTIDEGWSRRLLAVVHQQLYGLTHKP